MIALFCMSLEVNLPSRSEGSFNGVVLTLIGRGRANTMAFLHYDTPVQESPKEPTFRKPTQ